MIACNSRFNIKPLHTGICLGLATLLCSLVTFGQQDAFDTCATISDNTARLTCVDAVISARRNAVQPEQPSPAAPGSIVENSATEAASVPPNQSEVVADSPENFGLEHKLEHDAEEAPLALAVVSASHNKLTGWTIEFSNGQVWKQVGTNKFDIRVGNTYLISRASLNSFMLGSTESRRQIRVTRVR